MEKAVSKAVPKAMSKTKLKATSEKVSITLSELVDYTNKLLEIDKFEDYCPNGLQVEGRSTISRIVTGVTASAALIDAAIHLQADAIIVHHGYFWKGEDSCITGIKGRRIKKLLQHDISLIAYHLPLDAHVLLGNNRQLATILDIDVSGGLDDSDRPIGLVGEIKQTITAAAFAKHIAVRLDREPLLIDEKSRLIKKVAWCTGAAQSYIYAAAAKEVDCFITGEVSESTVHIARELGICFIAAGHHATERYGVKVLGEKLAQKFDIDCEFVDIDNPV